MGTDDVLIDELRQTIDILVTERDEARANGAASERAAIVAFLRSLGSEWTGSPRSIALGDAANHITRLDHHRDGGGE